MPCFTTPAKLFILYSIDSGVGFHAAGLSSRQFNLTAGDQQRTLEAWPVDATLFLCLFPAPYLQFIDLAGAAPDEQLTVFQRVRDGTRSFVETERTE